MLAKLLLIEDEKGLALTVTDRLAAEDYAVDHAADGQAGLDMALAGNYQLVILDVMLPRKSGLDVCRAIRQNGLRTPRPDVDGTLAGGRQSDRSANRR